MRTHHVNKLLEQPIATTLLQVCVFACVVWVQSILSSPSDGFRSILSDGNPSEEFPVLDGNPSTNMNSAN